MYNRMICVESFANGHMSEKTSCNKRARTSSYGEAVRIESIDWKDLSESSGQSSKSLLQIIEKAFGKVRKTISRAIETRLHKSFLYHTF